MRSPCASARDRSCVLVPSAALYRTRGPCRARSAHIGANLAMLAGMAATAAPPFRVRPAPRRRGNGFRISFGALRRSVANFVDDDVLTLAAALAFYTMLSFAPLIV